MEIMVGLNTHNRKDVPSATETIDDVLKLDKLVKVFNSIKIYFRDKESCPYNRGNWVIDFFSPHNDLFPGYCLKLPASMDKKEIMRWVKPLTEKLKEINTK